MNILNLPNWKIAGEVEENEHDYVVLAEPQTKLTLCPHCDSTELLRYGKKTPLFMHLPAHGKRVGIRAQVQRYKCENCLRISQQPLPDVDERRHATTKLVRYVQQQSLLRPFTAVAGEVGMHERSVRRLFNEYRDELERTHKFMTPEWLGMDEITIKRTPRLVLTNLREGTIFDMWPSRKEALIKRRLSELPNREKVRLVAIDMWRPYKLVIRATLPHAKIVVDKFHVVRQANKALDDYRKHLRAGLSAGDRRKLMRHRFILLKRKHDLNDEERLKLEMWTTGLAMLGTAHELKESFYAIYEAKDRHEAKRLYWDWLMSIPKELEPFFRELTTALKNWEEEIFAYFDYRITNAFTESMNSITRKAESEGRGYSFEALRAKVLYTSGFKTAKRPKFQRRISQTMNLMSMDSLRDLLAGGEVEVVNYGVPISTFFAKYERGEF